MKVTVLGGGLAGCEAAWQLARYGIDVRLYEMKPKRFSPAHRYDGLAELVCSNSLKAKRLSSASGMLKEEMRLFHSLILQAAEQSSVQAGGALAVDRTLFSDKITEAIMQNPHITLIRDEVLSIPDGHVIIATGPLTSDRLAQVIFERIGCDKLHFYDAVAPIVTGESVCLKKAFFAARYGRGDADYLNCPMNEEEYNRFYQALIEGETAPLHDFDKASPAVYEGCMPIEVMAKRGRDTIRFGPLRPVGLRNPETQENYYAVLQLRREDTAGELYNLVGFQTNLRFPEQKRIFSMIPGLEDASFVRYGVMHRNTYIESPRLLNHSLCYCKEPRIQFAGQITGVEGYVESAAMGILAGFALAYNLKTGKTLELPVESMMGALVHYITQTTTSPFQPMGANMGLLPPLEDRERNKQTRYEKLGRRGVGMLQKALAEAVLALRSR